jgi:hypothetical protein
MCHAITLHSFKSRGWSTKTMPSSGFSEQTLMWREMSKSGE